MNILYVITGLGIGGAEVITLNLAQKMQQIGHKVVVMYLTGKNMISNTDVLEIIGLDMKKNPLGILKALLKARKICKNFSPTVIHANMFHAIIFSRFLRIIYPVKKLVDTVHTINVQGRLRMFILKITDFLSDVTTNVSEETVDYFVKKNIFKRKKSIAVHNGIDLSKFNKDFTQSLRIKYDISPNTFVFLNISRLMPAKDHKTLLDAFKIVHEINSDTKLICVGDGELFNDTVDYSRTLKIDDSIIFTGAKQEVVSYYNTADCFVLSSAWEGFGIVLAEAMACELPVISTDCGGTKEVVQNNCYLVPIKSPEKLAEKMLELSLLSANQIEEIGKKNREKASKFEIDNIVKQWISIYE